MESVEERSIAEEVKLPLSTPIIQPFTCSEEKSPENISLQEVSLILI